MDDVIQHDADFIALTTDIVGAYVAKNNVPAGDLPTLIASTYEALAKLGAPAPAVEEKPTPPVPIRKTVTPDHIISLEDGKPYKTLKRHLTTRGLTPEAYRQKWGLPHDYPMVAANYAAARSGLAKAAGLGQIRRDRAAAQKPGATAPAARRGRPKKADAVSAE